MQPVRRLRSAPCRWDPHGVPATCRNVVRERARHGGWPHRTGAGVLPHHPASDARVAPASRRRSGGGEAVAPLDGGPGGGRRDDRPASGSDIGGTCVGGPGPAGAEEGDDGVRRCGSRAPRRLATGAVGIPLPTLRRAMEPATTGLVTACQTSMAPPTVRRWSRSVQPGSARRRSRNSVNRTWLRSVSPARMRSA